MNTVYILGAGFSAPYLPVQTHLLDSVLKFTNPQMERPEGPKTRSDVEFVGIAANLQQWFGDQFGPDYSDVWLEDVFTRLDHITDVPTPREDIQAMQQLRRKLDFALAYYLRYKPYNTSKIMKRRLSQMKARSVLHGIITLNWDTLLQRVALFNYGVPIHSVQGERVHRRSVPLLKLHGSADWWRCTRCRSLVADSSLAAFFETKCPVCQKSDTRFDSVLMMPTLMKNPMEGPLQEIWRLAFVLLAGADEIVFMGYSLPQADHALYYMVMEAKRSNAQLRAILREDDRDGLACRRFRSLIRHIDLDFRGIDAFLEVASETTLR